MSQFVPLSWRVVLPAVLLAAATSACQTIDEGAAPYANTWSPAPMARVDDGARPPSGSATRAAALPKGTPLLSDAPRGKTTFLEGTGRFIGDPQPRAGQTASQGNDGVTLNLVNVPAPQAAKTILGDILAVKYTVDPGIEGKITIQTPKPVPRAEVVDLFQQALRSNNAAIVNANGLYKIVPAEQAAVGATIQLAGVPPAGALGSAADGEKLGSDVKIVQLKYVAASEMRRILEPIAPRGSIIRTDDARNILTLSGNSHDIASMLEAIAIFDVDVMRGMSFALVPVRTSQPSIIADELRTVFASEREGPMAGMVQFLPNKRLGAILIISPQPKYLARAASWVRRLDAQAEGSEKQFFTYAVQNRRAQELVDVLQSMFSTETGGAKGATRNVTPQARESTIQSRNSSLLQSASTGTANAGFSPQMASAGGGVSSSSSSGSFASRFGGQGAASGRPGAPASGQETAAAAPVQVGRDEATGEPRVKLAADEAKNAILIEATPVDYRRIMRVIGSLDVVANQVLIEATIAEVSLNDDLKFGVRWAFNAPHNTSYTFTDAASGAVSSVFPGFSYAVTAGNVAASLNALNSVTEVNIISSPSLTVMDNRTAELQIGDQVPISTQSAVSVLSPGAPIINSVSYRDTGVILSLTPRINQSGRVLLDIEQEVSSVASTTSSGIDSPTIRQRRIRTSVVVTDGETLALGGMIQDSRTRSRNQIPIFGDIPAIGNIFKQKDNTIGKTELIVLITPHVVRNLDEARRVTDEFRRELSISMPRGPRIPPRLEHTIDRTFD